MKFKAIDLSLITPDNLRFRPRPLCEWPTVEINVDDVKEQTCIASWKWDVDSARQISDKMSECAWDGLYLGFSYLLSDIISLPQTAPDIAQRLATFSQLYESLHAVVAYEVDPNLRRAWLRHEACRILKSPTRLPYIYRKWQLRIPLKFSLIINQICTRRLGLHEFNAKNLHLCDTDDAYLMTLGDLGLFDGAIGRTKTVSISLDRRYQTFASDVLLIYELNLVSHRPALIAKLRALKSNSVVIPALVVIWAMIEGLSISVRGCDWKLDSIMEFTKSALREACSKMREKVRLEVAKEGTAISLDGAIKARMTAEIDDPPYGLMGPKNLIVRCRDEPAKSSDPVLLWSLLEECVDYAQLALRSGNAREPAPLSADAPQYELLFDETPGHGGPEIDN